jgi:hypothetical protein
MYVLRRWYPAGPFELIAISTQNGDDLWESEIPFSDSSDPSLVEDPVFGASSNRLWVQFNMADGEDLTYEAIVLVA